MQSYDHQINSTKEIIKEIPKNDLEACPECNRRVYCRGKGVKCEKCDNCFHEKILMIKIYAKMKDMLWYCSNCKKINNLEIESETEKHLFFRQVDNIICTVGVEPDTLLIKVNTLYRKLELTMEKADENDNLAFLDMNINVNSCKEINREWYKKPTDTGVVSNFCSCAPIQHKRNNVEVTVHRVL